MSAQLVEVVESFSFSLLVSSSSGMVSASLAEPSEVTVSLNPWFSSVQDSPDFTIRSLNPQQCATPLSSLANASAGLVSPGIQQKLTSPRSFASAMPNSARFLVLASSQSLFTNNKAAE